jgi:hypothetical protein
LLELEVWKFEVDVIDDKIKRTFTSQTDRTWSEFSEEAYRQFATPRSEVWLGYRFGRDSAWVVLKTEIEWAKALEKLRKKMKAARWVPVTMEIKNMVSHAAYKEGVEAYFGCLQYESTHKNTSKVQSSKGKGKRSRQDDIPPAPTPEMAERNGYLQELKQHLLCQTHSKPGQLTYCAIDQPGADRGGGHDPLTHKDITYWANEIVSSEIERAR